MSDPRKRLLGRIDEIRGYDDEYDEDADLIVDLDIFFDGNEDEGSIGCNLNPHPGVRTFERVLKAIRDRPEVSSVMLHIDEVLEDFEDWPFVAIAYVTTSVPAEIVLAWAAELQPDGFDDEVTYGTWRSGACERPNLPDVSDGHRIVVLAWD